jgi:hypothetical protein
VRCEKLGRPCTGYDLERKFLDEGVKVRRKYDGNFHQPDFARPVVATPPGTKATTVPPAGDQRINLPPLQGNFSIASPPIPHSFPSNSPPIPQATSPRKSSLRLFRTA